MKVFFLGGVVSQRSITLSVVISSCFHFRKARRLDFQTKDPRTKEIWGTRPPQVTSTFFLGNDLEDDREIIWQWLSQWVACIITIPVLMLVDTVALAATSYQSEKVTVVMATFIWRSWHLSSQRLWIDPFFHGEVVVPLSFCQWVFFTIVNLKGRWTKAGLKGALFSFEKGQVFWSVDA